MPRKLGTQETLFFILLNILIIFISNVEERKKVFELFLLLRKDKFFSRNIYAYLFISCCKNTFHNFFFSLAFSMDPFATLYEKPSLREQYSACFTSFKNLHVLILSVF